MSTDKYAQFISAQQKQLSVSGVNTVNLNEAGSAVGAGGSTATPTTVMGKAGTKVQTAGGSTGTGGSTPKPAAARPRPQTALANSYEVEDEDLDQLAEKELSAKQKKIAAQAGDPDKIEGEDFAKLRAKNEAATPTVPRMPTTPKIPTTPKMPTVPKALLQKADYGDFGSKKTQGKLSTDGKPFKPDSTPSITGAASSKGSTTLHMIKKKPVGEEIEEFDEAITRASKGKHASLVRTRPVRPPRAKYKGKPTIPSPQKLTNSYEISDKESAHIAEAVAKGKLPEILAYHGNAMKHHEKMLNHHNDMAMKSEKIGDSESFDHHTMKAMGHSMDMEHHAARYNHAAGLKSRANAQREMKSAQAAMKAADEKIRQAKADKKDW